MSEREMVEVVEMVEAMEAKAPEISTSPYDLFQIFVCQLNGINART
jgi:hypothetical protein